MIRFVSSAVSSLPQVQVPQRAHGRQDPCACATYGKLEEVLFFVFPAVKWTFRWTRPDFMLYSYR